MSRSWTPRVRPAWLVVLLAGSLAALILQAWHPLPPDMAESVRFFLGLALLRAGSTKRAVLAFDAALEAAPQTAWRGRVLNDRAEARAQTGDVGGAAVDLRAASLPPAARTLDALGRRDRP